MNIMKLITWYYGKKLNPKTIDRCLHKAVDGSAPPKKPLPREGELIVSCVQRQTRFVRSAGGYVSALQGFVREASQQGSSLVIFPEYNFFDLFGFIPGFTALNWIITAKAKKRLASPPAEQPAPGAQTKSTASQGDPNGMGAFFMALSGPVERAVRQIISFLSSAYGITIYSGSFVAGEGGHLYNQGCLYGPDGACIGTQRKMHLTDSESQMGMSRGAEIKVFTLPFGTVAFPVCMDATYFETFRLAIERGADIVILPISNDEEYEELRALRGIWTRVQESFVYGLKSSQNGWIAGMHFTGKAGVFAPLSMTPGRDGVVSISPQPEGNFLVTTPIDIEKLRQARKTAMYFGDSNAAFESDYVSRTYSILP
ncbi:MAG: nitrilase-related carbon-nitrogen hydrolase [Clostridia bacterium]|nr:nitrilase-related carbon-nitrogen hydrolase [Clostridia bacterium]